MKFAFYGGQSGKGDGESIQIFTLPKRKCTQTETEICWTLIFQQVNRLGDHLVIEISVAGRHLDGFHTKASSGIFLPLSSSLNCSHMYEVWPPVRGSTDIWRNRGHWELNGISRWISDSHRFISNNGMRLTCFNSFNSFLSLLVPFPHGHTYPSLSETHSCYDYLEQ